MSHRAHPKYRVQMILVQPVLQVLDEDGDVVNEQQPQPIPLYRKSTPDVWKKIDELVADLASK